MADAKIAAPAINACAKSGEWEAALCLLRSTTKSDQLLYRAAITACGKGLRWDLSLALLAESGPHVDVFTYGAAISACERGFEWQRAVALVRKMMSDHLRLDCVHYNAVILALDRTFQWELAVAWCLSALADRSADEGTLLGALGALATAGQWERSLQLMALPVPDHLKWPSVEAYGKTLMAAYRSEHVEVWQACVQMLTEMPQRLLHPGPSELACAARICGRGCKWLEALTLQRAASSVAGHSPRAEVGGRETEGAYTYAYEAASSSIPALVTGMLLPT
ncbi:EMB2654 [Symbiodinium pilosum]|uniref:EMB2654 protein n=1 Tax=Symbiodinium pilosum TaxID=2952 RepID=A0A812XV65_SYMPI|nr:EMB2654 [Symbiodinium pilosum]